MTKASGSALALASISPSTATVTAACCCPANKLFTPARQKLLNTGSCSLVCTPGVFVHTRELEHAPRQEQYTAQSATHYSVRGFALCKQLCIDNKTLCCHYSSRLGCKLAQDAKQLVNIWFQAMEWLPGAVPSTPAKRSEARALLTFGNGGKTLAKGSVSPAEQMALGAQP